MTSPEQKQQHFRDAMAANLKKTVEFPSTTFVTVVDAKMAPDQANAKVILSVIPVTDEEIVLESLKTYRHDIIKEMARSMRLRHLPKIHWTFDQTEEKAFGIEKYIDELKDKGEL
ncbi:MAG: ribosome-binding factor A [Patescibacteria group bacterium]|jgi:ribosome-binding factor A